MKRELLCPVCGCTIVPDEAHEKDGVWYCCEPCAMGQGQCGCGCCTVAEDGKHPDKTKNG
jgi:hypothetical protein